MRCITNDILSYTVACDIDLWQPLYSFSSVTGGNRYGLTRIKSSPANTVKLHMAIETSKIYINNSIPIVIYI